MRCMRFLYIAQIDRSRGYTQDTQLIINPFSLNILSDGLSWACARLVKDNDVMELENMVEFKTHTSAPQFTVDVTHDRDTVTESPSDDLSSSDQQEGKDARERNPRYYKDVEEVFFDLNRFRRQCTKTVNVLLVAALLLCILVVLTGLLVLAEYVDN